MFFHAARQCATTRRNTENEEYCDKSCGRRGGIEQLFGLVLVGGMFAFLMQRKLAFRLMHWATILPCVVLANAIRLIVTVLLVRTVGEVVLGNTWHIALGWTQTILAVVLLWLFGKAIHALTD